MERRLLWVLGSLLSLLTFWSRRWWPAQAGWCGSILQRILTQSMDTAQECPHSIRIPDGLPRNMQEGSGFAGAFAWCLFRSCFWCSSPLPVKQLLPRQGLCFVWCKLSLCFLPSPSWSARWIRCLTSRVIWRNERLCERFNRIAQFENSILAMSEMADSKNWQKLWKQLENMTPIWPQPTCAC